MLQSFSSLVASVASRELFVREDAGHYRAANTAEVLARANGLLAQRVRRGTTMSSPAQVRDHLRFQLGALEHEVFVVVFLDAQNRLIATKEMFRGTLTQTSVYPREVVKEALTLNAAAVILAHNHPSGSAEPSRADEYLTQTLKSTLALIDVRVLDHFVIAGAEIASFAERGLV